MKPGVVFVSGAILGAAGAYLITNTSESCDNLKGGARKKKLEGEVVESFEALKKSNSVEENGVLFNKDKTVLLKYNCDKKSSTYKIPDSVMSIRKQAFYYCTRVKSVIIPNSVTSIGEQAFYYCIKLKNIQIPKSVTSIGSYAFGECMSLTNILVDEANNDFSSVDGVLFDKKQTKLIIYPSAKIGENYKIPDSVTSIDDYAFSNCSSLKTITIPSSVTRIGEGAFLKCTALTKIAIPTSVTSIGNIAFDGCSSLETITIPAASRLTSIGSSAFRYCSSLTSITIPSSVTSIWARCI